MKPPFWKKFGKDRVCGISHARLRPGKTKDGLSYVVFLPCGHGFYRKPLMIWINTNNICPMCRKPFDPFKIYEG